VAGVRNIFSIGRDPDAEDQLTEMLAWLASTVPGVIAELVGLAFEPSPIAVDEDAVSLSTQHVIGRRRLDALVESANFALIIESKLGSGYGAGQLSDYMTWLALHRPDRQRALMTLTKYDAEWGEADLALALESGILAARKRWQDLYGRLHVLVESAESGDVGATLVGQFLEMLREEDLIPVQPLTEPELASAWHEGRETMKHFRDFLDSCVQEIEGALGATAGTKSSLHTDFIWQDFWLDETWRLGVVFQHTDAGPRLKRRPPTHVPILRIGLRKEPWPNAELLQRLEAAPPAGWELDPDRWYARATIWRYLADVLGDGAFEQQRQRLVEACVVAKSWIAGISE
jgi:hypothetical protein